MSPASVDRHPSDAEAAPSAGRWSAPLVSALVVAVLGVLPALRTPDFYFWDDSAAVFLPTWRAIGLDLLSGTWPTLRPDLWMGGNWAAEAQFGLFSPVNLAVYAFVALLPDLALAATIVKVAFLVLLVVGAQLLAREYGAKPWPAAAVMTALPFTGFTLYFDTSAWVAGLMAFAWTPWFWMLSRRVGRRATNPFWMFVAGYLLITNGNPYGALAAVFVLAGVGIEALLRRDWGGFGRLFVTGLLVGATVVAPYLPLVLSSSVGWRESQGFYNDGFLVPDVGMLVASSHPGAMPWIINWQGDGSQVPLTYSAWFLTPLLPWLPWSWLRGRGKALAGLSIVGGLYLVMLLGPSNLWLFRWPVRLLEYVWLVVFVLLAVLLSRGLRTTSAGTRAALTALAVAWGGWAAISGNTDFTRQMLLATAIHAVLALLLVGAILRARGLLEPLLMAGVAVVLGLHLWWFPANYDVSNWRNPSSVAQLEAFGAQYKAPVYQVADYFEMPVSERPGVWQWFLFGSMPAATGAESTASYSGLGFNDFSGTLCMNHAGTTCRAAFDVAFQPVKGSVPAARVVDATKSNTVVVQRRIVPEIADFRAPSGWHRTVLNETVAVFERTGDLRWPDSRLSSVSPGTTVAQAQGTDTLERLRVSTDRDGGLLFARLAWPGYAATVNGAPATVRANGMGLLEVMLPAGLKDAEVVVQYKVPGFTVGVPLLFGAVVAAAALGAVVALRDRRNRSRNGHAPSGTGSKSSPLQ